MVVDVRLCLPVCVAPRRLHHPLLPLRVLNTPDRGTTANQGHGLKDEIRRGPFTRVFEIDGEYTFLIVTCVVHSDRGIVAEFHGGKATSDLEDEAYQQLMF